MEDFALVYQCGIANVFRTGGRPSPERVIQHSFRVAEAFCAGLRAAGKNVGVYHCDTSGDITTVRWERGCGDMFARDKQPPAVWV